VIGSGSAGDPFRSNNGGSTSADVRLLWPGPIGEVQLTYVAGADGAHPFVQQVGIGKFAFAC
jgi:hypothetical protein